MPVNTPLSSLKSLRARARAHARHFGRNEDGSMLLFGMIILIMMLWSGGMAVDAMRVETTRTVLQNTLDRAVLAAADLDQSEDAKLVVLDYFEKAGLEDYIDPTSISVSSTTASGELSYRRVSATASADVNTLFMDLLGIDNMVAGASGTAEEGITNLEISLVVDVSGSMGWSSSTGHSKIYELRNAAKDFVYYMQCNPNATRASGAACTVEPGKVSISLVPYSEQVNAGANLIDNMGTTALDEPMMTTEHPYSNCVTFTEDDFATATVQSDPDVQLLRTGHFDPWSGGTNASNGSRTCRTDAWREIQPFMGDHTDLENKIGNLSAGGNTSIDVAMKWGAMLLDPTMRDTINTLTTISDGSGGKLVNPAFNDRPYSYTQDYSMKVIVLMTDGVNTSQHYLKDGYRDGPSPIYRNTERTDRYSIYNASTGKYYYIYDGTWNDYPYGDADGEEVTVTNTTCRRSWYRGYTCTTTTETQVINQPGSAVRMSYPEVWKQFTTDWFGSWSWLENPDSYFGNSTKDQRLRDICAATKDEGVIVYTIGFEVSEGPNGVMHKCASTPGHYFNADGANLAETFGVIASSINQLRLTQ